MSDRTKREDAGALDPETRVVQALGRFDAATRALVPPLHPSTTYLRDPDGGYRSGRSYTRADNPTYDTPEDLLAELEGGADALLFASGVAAATSVFQALLPGDHVVVSRVMYWALRKWLGEFATSWGLEVEFVDTTSLDALRAAVRAGKTRLVWIETPANPTWAVTDIGAAAEIAHAAHARLAVDSTAATPVLTRPIALGADLVMHSATKYLNGHSDVLAGALVTARRDGLWQRIRAWRRDAGAMLGPFEAWLLLRGMRTLFVRIERSCDTALAVARHFQNHPRVARVLYPGLPEHPGHTLAARQMNGGFGGMLSIRVAGGEEAAMAVAGAARVFKRATSLGGVESLIEHRASVEGPSTPVPRDLLRLSIGLESAADLVADLEQALASSGAVFGDRSTPEPSDTEPRPTAGATAAVRAVLDERVRPRVLDRGGDVVLAGVSDGIVTLEIAGSPGASMPLRAWAERALRAQVPGIAAVRWPVAEDRELSGVPLEEAVRGTLDQCINPAVAAHDGRIALERIVDGTAYLTLEGRCQGCAKAEVTLREGVEAILRERCPALVAVVDVTDHAAGANPYYAPGKGGDNG